MKTKPVDEVAEAGDEVARVARSVEGDALRAGHVLQRVGHRQQRACSTHHCVHTQHRGEEGNATQT